MKSKAAAALFLVFVALFLALPGQAEAVRFSQTVSSAEFERMADEKVAALLRDKGETRRHEVALVKPPRDMKLPAGEVSLVRGRCLKDKGEALGHVVSRLVPEGAVLSEEFLRQPVVMESGAMVTIVSHYNGIEVRVSGIALNRGRPGQKIRVRNAASRKVMLATVLDASTVEIGS